MADVAQMEAQQASDAYNLTHQQNLYETAMLTLKQKMNFPIEEALLLDTCLLEAIYTRARTTDHRTCRQCIPS